MGHACRFHGQPSWCRHGWTSHMKFMRWISNTWFPQVHARTHLTVSMTRHSSRHHNSAIPPWPLQIHWKRSWDDALAISAGKLRGYGQQWSNGPLNKAMDKITLKNNFKNKIEKNPIFGSGGALGARNPRNQGMEGQGRVRRNARLSAPPAESIT